MKELFGTQNSQIDKILTTMSELQSTTIQVQASVNHLTEENSELKKIIEQMDIQAKKDNERIVLLEHKLEDVQKMERKTNIEIKNVPLKGDENKRDFLQMVSTLSKNLDIQIERSDVKDIIRTKKPNTERSTLIVELSNTFIKADLLKAAKTYNNKNKNNKLSARFLGLNKHGDTPIFISEHLTPKASRLFFLAREFRVTNKYKYCWTSYSKVYLRQDDNTPIITVSNEAQFQQLMKM